MKACPKCEHNNDEDAKYCSVCGSSLKTSKNFLNNAYQGKNNWWIYLITILSTWGVQVLIGIVGGIVLVIFLIMQNGISTDFTSYLYNPFLLLPLTLVSFAASYAIFYIFTRFIHKKKFISFITTESKINWRRILKGAGLWLAILSIFTVISILTNPGEFKFTFNLGAFGILLIISLITFPIQASFEEVFFRGYLMQGIGLLSKKPIMPLLATSILFALMHVLNGPNGTVSGFAVAETLIIGLMFGVITLGENSIETATGMHVINNIYASLIVSTQDSVLGNVPSVFTAPYDPYSSILWSFIVALIAITIIFWGKKDKLLAIFKWKDAELN
ncbi:MAG: CPBP family intramembrane metalloprotease [Methanobacterium sp.]|uniref:CPBP family intramembrane glutamic endopeptidase n=1 Tax=Methanobacterium sp. TaxID=2164 RepID=UPI003D65F4EB|nr:CPBP family intramembrane metalloprotease [Methanobacterium sp.]